MFQSVIDRRTLLQAADHVLESTRQAAEQLRDDLEAARQATGDWAAEALTDVLVGKALADCLGRLAAIGCWGPDNRVPSSEIWRKVGPLLARGRLQRQAREKPRGYAGDYQMLAWIVDEVCVDDPLGRAFDRYFLNQAAPVAVRGRTAAIGAALVAHRLTRPGDYRATSVGCGPGLDIARGLAALPPESRERARVTLLDLDPEGLAFAAAQVGPWLPQGNVQAVRENLFRLPGRRDAVERLGRPDFLVCSGLFDYLETGVAATMLACFWESLRPGGQMLVGNFAPDNPSRAYMEWIGNWYLTYRTEDELRALAAEARIPADSLQIVAEPLGLDLFIDARKGKRGH